MRQHAAFGGEILAQIPSLAQYAPIVRAHHERVDGSGYPDGFAGDLIPFEARVVAVADAFHAMVSDRPYRRAFSYGAAITLLGQGRGTQWDAEVVDAMVDRRRASAQPLRRRRPRLDQRVRSRRIADPVLDAITNRLTSFHRV